MQYARTAVGEQRRAANTARSGKQPVQSGQPGGQNQPAPPEPPYDRLVQALVPPPAERDPTLQNLRCASEKALSWSVPDPNLDARSEGRPALFRAILHTNRRHVQRFVGRLRHTAAQAGFTDATTALDALKRGAIDALALLESSIDHDTDRIEALATPA